MSWTDLLRRPSIRHRFPAGAFRRGVLATCLAAIALAGVGLAAGCQTPNAGHSELSSTEDADSTKAKTAREIPKPDRTSAAPNNESTLQAGTCRPGSTFRTITGEAANPQACRDICRNLMNCMAFTYLAEPAPGAGASCELKHSIAERVKDSTAAPKGCVSWVNPRAAQQLARLKSQGLELRSERPGENFREFEMNHPDPSLCQEACQNLRDCAAFTYTRPGYDGETARCALKKQAKAPIGDRECCISGAR